MMEKLSAISHQLSAGQRTEDRLAES